MHFNVRNKQILIGFLLFLLICGGLFFTKYLYLEKIETNHVVKMNDDLFAIKIENNNGEYENSENVPESGYLLNTSESYCQIDGVLDSSVTMEYTDSRVYISATKKGTKCYLYFDKITDSSAPVLVVSAPTGLSNSNPTYTTNSLYTVKGTVSDESGVLSVIVNGTEVTVGSDGAWSTSLTLTANTVTQVTVVATDTLGYSTTATNYVMYDSSDPTLSVSAPTGSTLSSPSSASSSTYTVSGTVSDTGSGIKSVTVNGVNVTVGSDGSWSKVVSLSDGISTQISVIATDYAGRTTTVNKYVKYSSDTSAPVVTVTYPSGSQSSPTYVSSSTITAYGTVTDSDSDVSDKALSVQVVANNTLVKTTATRVNSDGTWSISLTLTEPNTVYSLRFSQVDSGGNGSATVYKYVVWQQ